MLKIVSRILQLSGRYKKKLIISFVMSFLESTMTSLSFFMIFLAIGWIANENLSTTRIVWLGAILLLAAVLRFTFKLMEYIFQSGVGYEIVCDERLRLGEKLLHLSMGFYNDTDAGNISSVINNDLVFVEGMAMSFLSKITGGIISGVLMTAFLFVMDWRIALIACIGYPAAWLLNRRVQMIYTKYSGMRQQSHAETSSMMLEYLQGIYVIKAFHLAGKQESRLEAVLKRLEIVSFDFEMKVLPWVGMYLTCFHIGTGLILVSVAYFFFGASLSFSAALIFVIMIFAFYAPMELVGLSSGFIRLMNACLDRMQSIMDCPVMDAGARYIVPERFDIQFDNVDFSYGEKPLFRNLSFHIPEYTMTAIVGSSGSGKTTLLNLIARFWDTDSGYIRMGGIDLKEMKCENVMEHISAVFQKAYLFHDTIYNNILFGNPNATEEQVMEAAKKAHCHEFIIRLQEGYHTVVGEAGSTLSGGERQRVSIARAMLKDASIILLDEVTANIDPENEMLIQQAINELVKGKTVFVVAHKLATIRNANQIIVLDGKGGIAEMGTHDQLFANEDGLYKLLWKKSQKISNWKL